MMFSSLINRLNITLHMNHLEHEHMEFRYKNKKNIILEIWSA